MSKFLATALLFFLCSASLADWKVVSETDDFTDEMVKYAVFIGVDHNIQISKQATEVWMFITRKKTGTFEPEGIIELRIDNNPVRIVDPVKSKQLGQLLGRTTFQWEPSTVGFLLWHGNESEGCGYIGQLLDGQELKVRYQINSMERDTFSASLNGAKSAIMEGLGLSSCS